MSNTYVNKVQTADGTTLIDLTSDTAVASNVVAGKYFHLATGERVQGSIATKTSSDLTASGATVTAPAGYYASDATKAVSNGSASTPATTITVTPGINVANSTGIITAYVSAGKNITPTVSEGYVTSGTSGMVTVTGDNTSQLSTVSGQTIHPSTSDQYIAAYKFTTGEQTIKAVTLSNLTAGNIKNGVTVKVGDSTDDDCVTSVTGTYEGGTGNDFIVTLSYNSTSEKWEPDKTYSEIITAYNAEKNIAVKIDGTYSYQNVTADGIVDDIEGTLVFLYNVREIVDDSPVTVREEIYELYQSTITINFTREYIIPSGSTTITQNGNNIDVTELSSINVAVSGGGVVITDTTDSAGGTIRTITAEAVNLQSKMNISPTTSSQTIEPDNGYTGLSSVQINAMPSGTAGTPTATKGTVSNHSISVTPSVTNQTGYITGSTKTGTAVTVNVTELESGNKEITENGTNISVSGYSTVSVAVPSGSSKNFQVSNTQVRLGNRTTLSDTGLTLTVAETGTYNVYWSAFRSNTSSGYTWGTQLYIGSNAYGSANTSWSNSYNQINKLTGVSLTKDQVLHVYGQTRSGSSYYICCSNLILEQTS